MCFKFAQRAHPYEYTHAVFDPTDLSAALHTIYTAHTGIPHAASLQCRSRVLTPGDTSVKKPHA